MKSKQKYSLRFVTSVLFLSLAIVPLGIMAGLSFWVARDILTNSALETVQHDVTENSELIKKTVSSFKKDLFTLSATPPPGAIIRALRNNGIDPVSQDDLSTWKQRLMTIFKANILKEDYHQITLLDFSGNELVIAHDRNNNEGFSPNEFNLGHKFLLKQIQDLKASEIFISKMHIHEGKKIFILTTPIFDSENKVGAFLSIHIYAEKVLKLLDINESKMLVVDNEGNYLHSASTSSTLHTPQNNTPSNLAEDHPEFIPYLAQESHTSLQGNKFISSQRVRVYPEQDRFWLIINTLDADEVLKPVKKIQWQITALMAFMFPLIFLTSFLLARSLSRPIADAVQLAKEIEKGDFHNKRENPSIFIETNRLTVSLLQMQQSLEKTIKQLKESEHKTQAIVDGATESIIMINREGVIESANPATRTIFDYAPEELIGQNVNILMPEPHHTQHDSYIKRYLDTGTARVVGGGTEVPGLHKDGRSLALYLSISKIELAGKIFFSGMMRDITREKKAEQLLQLLQEITIVANASETLDDTIKATLFKVCTLMNWDVGTAYIFDKEQEILTSSKLCHVNESMSPDNLHGVLEHKEFKKGEDLPGQVLSTGNAVYFENLKDAETPRLLNLGEIFRSGFAFPVLAKTEIHLVLEFFSCKAMELDDALLNTTKNIGGQVQKVIERNIAKEDLIDANRKLLRQENLASLGSMVAGVAHEVNTPVGIGVTAASELQRKTQHFMETLEEEGISEEELSDYLGATQNLTQLILGNLKRAADLVRSFKLVAVDQSSEEQRTFKLKEYLDTAILSLQHEMKRTQIQVIVNCPDDLEITSYPGAYSQIVSNFINNSRIHAFEDGEKGKIEFNISVMQNILHFTYSDNGKGMEPQVKEKIFDPFFTTNREEGGSGLGMNVVYNLVTQKLEGEIECSSLAGQGTTFMLYIPHSSKEVWSDRRGGVDRRRGAIDFRSTRHDRRGVSRRHESPASKASEIEKERRLRQERREKKKLRSL